TVVDQARQVLLLQRQIHSGRDRDAGRDTTPTVRSRFEDIRAEAAAGEERRRKIEAVAGGERRAPDADGLRGAQRQRAVALEAVGMQDSVELEMGDRPAGGSEWTSRALHIVVMPLIKTQRNRTTAPCHHARRGHLGLALRRDIATARHVEDATDSQQDAASRVNATV